MKSGDTFAINHSNSV